MHIASIHNHPKQFYSPPSGKNFQMLGFDFEDFELILSEEELWILESCEVIFTDEEIEKIRKKANDYFKQAYDEVNQDFEKGYQVADNVGNRYGDYLINYLNNYSENIKLTRRILNG
jgi:hypothetical protein